MVPCSSAPEFWMEKVRRAAPQALVAWGAALSALYAKILRQNRCFLMLTHLRVRPFFVPRGREDPGGLHPRRPDALRASFVAKVKAPTRLSVGRWLPRIPQETQEVKVIFGGKGGFQIKTARVHLHPRCREWGQVPDIPSPRHTSETVLSSAPQGRISDPA